MILALFLSCINAIPLGQVINLESDVVNTPIYRFRPVGQPSSLLAPVSVSATNFIAKKTNSTAVSPIHAVPSGFTMPGIVNLTATNLTAAAAIDDTEDFDLTNDDKLDDIEGLEAQVNVTSTHHNHTHHHLAHTASALNLSATSRKFGFSDTIASHLTTLLIEGHVPAPITSPSVAPAPVLTAFGPFTTIKAKLVEKTVAIFNAN